MGSGFDSAKEYSNLRAFRFGDSCWLACIVKVRINVGYDLLKKRLSTIKMKTTPVEDAAHWAARFGAPDCTAAEYAEFERWLREEPTHAEAFSTALEVSAAIDVLAADPRLRAMAEQANATGGFETARGVAARHRRWLPMAWAAGIAVLALSALLLQRPSETVRFATASGEQRSLTLEDGSEVHLDVASEIAVRLSERRREVELLAGRALFHVAHDRERPFSVSVGDNIVTALGTRFQVQKQDRTMLVTLTEGSVEVSAAHEASMQRLEPGEQMSVDTVNHLRVKRVVDTEMATSWSRGRHLFRSTPLSEALAEVNRYATHKVRLGDPSLADLTVSGNFIAGDSEQIVKAFAAVLPLRIVSGGREIVLFGTQGSPALPPTAGS